MFRKIDTSQSTLFSHKLVGRLAGAGGAGALLAAAERVATVALRALAVVTSGQVLADGVDAAHRLPNRRCQALVDVLALAGFRVPVVPATADALAVSGNARLAGLAFGVGFAGGSRRGR